MHETPAFLDRRDAGRRLARALAVYADAAPLILALPRGGVPVAFEVAMALAAPLDVLIVRKIGAPDNDEFGLGAVADGREPQIMLNDAAIDMIKPPATYIDAETRRQLREIARRRRAYLGTRPPLPVTGRTVIVVDDGVATGGTIRAAAQALRRNGAAPIVLAAPVVAADTLGLLRQDADRVVYLAAPADFRAVSLYYADFTQTDDDEVIRLLAMAGR